MDRKCFLCTKEDDGNFSSDSQENILILCQIINVRSHVRNDAKTHENISFCHPCKKRILNVQDLLEKIEKLKKEVLHEKYLFGLQLERNYQNNFGHDFKNTSHHQLGMELCTEMRFNSIKLKLGAIQQKRSGRRVSSWSKSFRIMKNVNIVNHSEYGALYEQNISKIPNAKDFTSLLISNLISSDNIQVLSENLPDMKPDIEYFVDTLDNTIITPFTDVGFHLTSCSQPETEQIVQKVRSRAKTCRVMKNVTIFKFLEQGTLLGLVSKFDIPEELDFRLTCSPIAIDEHQVLSFSVAQPLVNESEAAIRSPFNEDVLPLTLHGGNFHESVILRICNPVDINKQHFFSSFPDTRLLVDVPKGVINLPFTDDEFASTSHDVNVHEMKFEAFSGDNNSQTEIKDPFEGIVPELNFITEEQTTKKTFICGACESNFDNYNQLHNHGCSKSLRYHPYPKEAKSNSSMKMYSSIHRVKKLHKCKYCEKTFFSHFNQERHERLHTGEEKPFKCTYCEKTFCDKNKVKRHARIHTGEQTCKLGLSEKSFTESSKWRLQDRMWTVEPRYKCEFCEKKFNLKKILKIHTRIHAGERPHVCTNCKKTFVNVKQLKLHELRHTEQKSFKCGYCEKLFYTAQEAKRHERTHSEEKSSCKCKYCGDKFTNPISLSNHQRVKIGEEHLQGTQNEIMCKTLLKKFNFKKSLKIHEPIHAGERPHVCTNCKKTFVNVTQLKLHERRHTEEKSFKCGYCEKLFYTAKYAKDHERTHADDKPCKCKYCGDKFTNPISLINHQRVEIGEGNLQGTQNEIMCKTLLKKFLYTHKLKKLFNCQYCERTFPSNFDLKRHEGIHTGANFRPLKCKHCKRTFRFIYCLKIHDRINHTGETPLKCKYCNKTFSYSHHKKLHERRHTGEKHYQCKYCQRLFHTSDAVNNHERTHTGEKPFNCKLCEKKFAQRSGLRNHQRVHTDVRYICTKCKRPFYNAEKLKLHERRHTRVIVKPFKCGHCEKSFSTKGESNRHERRHTSVIVKPFKCGYCEKSFSTKGEFNRHEGTHSK